MKPSLKPTFLPFFALLLACIACNESNIAASDLIRISNIEVTQAIQKADNSIPLIAQRSTAFRVKIEADNQISGISGRLAVTVDGTPVTPVGGIAAINQPFTIPSTFDNNEENHTLNFELLAPTGITASSDVDITVIINTDNQIETARVENLSAVEVQNPSLLYLPVEYNPSNLGPPDANLIEAGTADALVQATFPINDANPLYSRALGPSILYDEDRDGNGIIDFGREAWDLESILQSSGNLYFSGSLSLDGFIFGWLNNGNLDSTFGLRNFYHTEPSSYQAVYAGLVFEQTIGYPTDLIFVQDAGWDVSARLRNNPTSNLVTERIRKFDTFDTENLWWGELTNETWVSEDTYVAMINSLEASTNLRSNQTETKKSPFILHGAFDAKGLKLLKLEPAFRYPWPKRETIEQEDDAFLLEVTDDQGESYKKTFNARANKRFDPKTNEALEAIYGFFEVSIALPDDRQAAAMQITDKSGKTVYTSIKATSPALLSISSPKSGSSLNEITELNWDVKNDTEEDTLQFQVAYSHDGGTSWVPLKADVSSDTRRLELNTQEIQASEGQGIIRLFVSDGLNTSFTDVANLRTLKALY